MGNDRSANPAATWVSSTLVAGAPVSRQMGTKSCKPECTKTRTSGSASNDQTGSSGAPWMGSIKTTRSGVANCTRQILGMYDSSPMNSVSYATSPADRASAQKASTSAKVVSTSAGAEGIRACSGSFRDTVFSCSTARLAAARRRPRPPCPRDCFRRLADGFEGGLLMEGTKNTAQPAPDSSVGLMERSRAAPIKAKSSRSST